MSGSFLFQKKLVVFHQNQMDGGNARGTRNRTEIFGSFFANGCIVWGVKTVGQSSLDRTGISCCLGPDNPRRGRNKCSRNQRKFSSMERRKARARPAGVGNIFYR